MLMDTIRPGRRLGNVRKLLQLPEEPADLVLARNNLTKLTADLERASALFEFVNMRSQAVDVTAPDGSNIPQVTDAVIMAAYRNVRGLEREVDAARRTFNEALRRYSDLASASIAAGCDEAKAAILNKLEEIDEWIELFADLRLAARNRGVVLSDRTVSRAGAVAGLVRDLRRQLGK